MSGIEPIYGPRHENTGNFYFLPLGTFTIRPSFHVIGKPNEQKALRERIWGQLTALSYLPANDLGILPTTWVNHLGWGSFIPFWDALADALWNNESYLLWTYLNCKSVSRTDAWYFFKHLVFWVACSTATVYQNTTVSIAQVSIFNFSNCMCFFLMCDVVTSPSVTGILF